MARVSPISLLLFSFLILNGCEEKTLTLSAPYGNNLERTVLAKSPQQYGGHLCLITPAGELFCLGNNDNGQLGIKTAESQNTLAKVEAAEAAKQKEIPWFSVALGSHHTCALKVDGSLWCWGSNQYSQLGRSDLPFDQVVKEPQKVPGLWRAVAAGATYTCAISAEKGLFCFGTAPSGGWPLGGNEKTLILNNPKMIAKGNNFLAMASSSGHLCAINEENELFCLGENNLGRLGNSQKTFENLTKMGEHKVNYIALGERESCALDDSGLLWCLGQDLPYMPRTLGLPPDWQKLDDTAWLNVTIGNSALCGLTKNGGMRCLGSNEYSELGVDDPSLTTDAPVINGDFVAAIPLGHTNCALKKSGELLCAGYGKSVADLLKEAPPPRITHKASPEAVAGDGHYTKVAAGEKHTCAIALDGSVWCFGDNSRGQCGAPLNNKVLLRPAPVDGLSMTMELSCGPYHCCALDNEGTARCFGDNSKGQFTDPARGKYLAPHQLGKKFRSISAGFEHTCGIDTEGDPVCYGSGNTFGAAAGSYGPFRLKTGNSWNKVIMGKNNICFLNKYQIACLGSNRQGQLFETGVYGRKSPSVLKMAAVNDLTMAGDSLIVIKRDGSLACWGAPNLCWPAAAQKENTVRQWPLSGGNFKTILAAEAGEGNKAHLCGLLAGGEVACLGSGEHGELADGVAKENYFVKEAQKIAGHWQTLAVGGAHTCFINESGELYCAGDNSAYQLGLPLVGHAELKKIWASPSVTIP